MKLFNFDEKHQQVNGEVDLGSLTQKERELVEKVLAFIPQDRYQSYILASSFTQIYNEEYMSEVTFNYSEE